LTGLAAADSVAELGMIADIGSAFVAQFARHSLLAAITAVFWFTIPGLLVLRLVGWRRRFEGALALLIAPAIGLCTFGPVSLLISTWRYTRRELILTWIGFNLLAALGIRLWGNGQRDDDGGDEARLPKLGPVASVLLPLGACLFGVFVTQCIYPGVRDNGLYVSELTYDHVKVALIDSIARQGLPAKNPYYAPAGKPILITYYYLWHFVASQPRLLNGVGGWEADVAITWFTAVAAVGLTMVLAVELTGRAAAGLVALLIASVAEISEPLLALLFPRAIRWVIVPGIEMPLWLQCGWVPQHVMSAVAVVLILMLLADVAGGGGVRGRGVVAVIIGLLGASGVGASFWVGGVALALASPLILVALIVGRIGLRGWRTVVLTLVVAVPIAVLFASPILYAQLVSPKPQKLPFQMYIMPASYWIGYSYRADWRYDAILKAGQISLFWVQTLPFTVGVSVVLGLPALVARRGDQRGRILRLIAGFGGLGFLLVTQFFKSTIANNDLGWRAPIVPIIMLGAWASAALVELPLVRAASGLWRQRAMLVRFRSVLIPLGWLGLALGLCSMAVFYPVSWTMVVPASSVPAHKRFLLQEQAWHDVRRFAAKDQLVQSNPDGFKDLVAWREVLPQALFSDRPTAYQSPDYAITYAYTYDRKQMDAQYQLIRRVFHGHPRRRDLRYLRDVLGVKVILVDTDDPLWDSKVLQHSHIYRLAERRKFYRIYVATAWHVPATSRLAGRRS
jgi:hypothetical protein